MRTLIIVVAVVMAAAGALAVHVTQSDARWHVLSETAINTNKLCTDGLKYTWAASQQANQPPANRPVGAARFVGPVDLVVQHAPSTTPSTEEDWFNAELAGADVFTADYKPVRNPDLNVWYPYSHAGVVPFRHPLPATSESVRLDTQPNGDSDAANAFEAVGNCQLFAGFDFQPGSKLNQLDFSVDGKPAAALLSTPTFNAANVTASTVLMGATGTEAAPLSSTTTDVNGDGRSDLKLQFQRSQTGLSCTSTEVLISAIDPASKKRFYEAAAVNPVNCP
jgi:hypothetical protein